ATRVEGPEALAAILGQLEGFEAPAAAWESELLPARVADYAISWLDDLCSAGRIQWLRLRPEARRPERAAADEEPAAGGAGQSLRATPLLLLPRRHAGQWARLAPPADGEVAASPRALKVLAHLREHGASFFDEIADDTRLLRTELEDALAELVARGQVHC